MIFVDGSERNRVSFLMPEIRNKINYFRSNTLKEVKPCYILTIITANRVLHVNVYNNLRNYDATRNLWKAVKIINIISASVGISLAIRFLLN